MMNNFSNKQDGFQVDEDIYFKTLCTSGLSFVDKEQKQIEKKRNFLVDNKQKLVFNNYDSFLKFSSFSKTLIQNFQDIEESLEVLKKTLPEFKTCCEDFSADAKKISTRWRNVSAMLIKYPQLIEFLEIPQLLKNCIRNFYYNDAFKMINFITKLCLKHASLASIFQNTLFEIEICKDIMITQLIKELSGNSSLPVCIKSVDYLKQCNRFTENQLKINFLICKDVWFEQELKKVFTNFHSLNEILSITEVFRINIFDIVTQYQAIFPEVNESIDKKKFYESKSKVINSWLLIKIDQYLKILQNNLNVCVGIDSLLSLEFLIDHCFYLGLSMNKIGADIRPQLTAILEDFLEKRFVHSVLVAYERFESSLSNIISRNVSNKNNDSFEMNIEKFPIILNYHKDLYSLFNEIRNNVPLSSIPLFVSKLNESFIQISILLENYINKHEYGLNSTEFQNFICFCNCWRNTLPLLKESFCKLCPIFTVSRTLGLTILDLKEIDLSKVFELDIETPIERMNNLIANTSKLI